MAEKGPDKYTNETQRRAHEEVEAQEAREKKERADAAKRALASSRAGVSEDVAETAEGHEKLYEKTYALGDYEPEGIENVDLSRGGITLKGSTDAFWFKEKPQSEKFYRELYTDAHLFKKLYNHLKIDNIDEDQNDKIAMMVDHLAYHDENIPNGDSKYSHATFLKIMLDSGFTKEDVYGSKGLLNTLLAFRRAVSTRVDTGTVNVKGKKIFRTVRRNLTEDDFKAKDGETPKFKKIELSLNTVRSQNLRSTKILAEKVKAKVQQEALKSTMHPYVFLKNFAQDFPKNFDSAKYKCDASRDGIIHITTTKGERVVDISVRTFPGNQYKIAIRGEASADVEFKGKDTTGVKEGVQKEIDAFEKPRNAEAFHAQLVELLKANDSQLRANYIYFDSPEKDFDYKVIVDVSASNTDRSGSRVYDVKINKENATLDFYKQGGKSRIAALKIDFKNFTKNIDAIRILHGEN